MRKIVIISVFLVVQFAKAQESEKSLSLQEAIDYAIKNSYDNLRAEKNIEAAKAKKWEATATGLPQIDGTIGYKNWLKQQVQLLPGAMVGKPHLDYAPVTFGTKQSMNASATLTQLIFSGSYLVGLQSAKTYLKISEQSKEKTELTTREAVINAYGNVLVAEESIKILEKNKVNLQETLNETKEIYKNGFTEQESVEQLEITLGMLDNNIRNVKRLQLISRQMLNISLGNKNNENIVLTDSLEELTNTVDLELLSKTFNINNHIDYRMAMNTREAQRLLLKLEKSKYLPTLVGFVNYGTAANSDDFSFLDNDQQWFDSSLLGVNLNIPIFSSFGRSAKTKQKRIALEQADIQLKEIEQKLMLQAEVSKSEYQLSIESLQTAKKNLELSERIANKNKIKFKEGISSSFDLLQAQNQLYTQQNNYIQSMLDVVAKKASLEVILNIK